MKSRLFLLPKASLILPGLPQMPAVAKYKRDSMSVLRLMTVINFAASFFDLHL